MPRTTRDSIYWVGSALAFLGVIGAVVFDVLSYQPRWAIASLGLVIFGVVVAVSRHQHGGTRAS